MLKTIKLLLALATVFVFYLLSIGPSEWLYQRSSGPWVNTAIEFYQYPASVLMPADSARGRVFIQYIEFCDGI